MRDIDDGDLTRRQPADRREQLIDLRFGERGRRLVHDQDAGVDRQRLRDFHHLLFGDAQAGDAGAWVDLNTQGLQKRARTRLDTRVDR